jgi:hypothetical protein
MAPELAVRVGRTKMEEDGVCKTNSFAGTVLTVSLDGINVFRYACVIILLIQYVWIFSWLYLFSVFNRIDRYAIIQKPLHLSTSNTTVIRTTETQCCFGSRLIMCQKAGYMRRIWCDTLEVILCK